MYVLQVFQSEIPERIRHLTKILESGEIEQTTVFIFVGLAIGILVFRTASRLLFFYPARVQQKLLRMELLELLEKVPTTRYEGRSQGQIFQILFDDINNLRAFVGFGLLQIGNLFIAAWVLIPKLNQTDSYLWPAFIPLFASVFLFTITSLINQNYFKKMMDKKGEVQQYIIESYEAKQTIKNFHREDSFIKGFVRVSTEELALFFKSAIGFAITAPYVKLGLGASLLWAALIIRARGGSSSDLVFFSGFLYLFLEPVMFMSWVAVVISQGFAAWRRVKELYGALVVPSQGERELAESHFEETSEGLRFSALFWEKMIGLSFKRRKWSVLVGETGSGKSYLLSRLATAMVLKNRTITMVQQEPYLFNDTIQENLFLGKEVTPELHARAIFLLKLFQLDNLAVSVEEVLRLEVGENGKRLSGGQIKRVALIRSILSGADILIWDDPFSSVDIILERRIINKLKNDPELKNCTFIISSHRLTTVKLSDEVIFIDKEVGIKKQGSSADILKEEDVAKFFKEQLVEIPLA